MLRLSVEWSPLRLRRVLWVGLAALPGLCHADSSTAGASPSTPADATGTSYYDELLSIRDKIDIGWGTIGGMLIVALLATILYCYRRNTRLVEAAAQRAALTAGNLVHEVPGVGEMTEEEKREAAAALSDAEHFSSEAAAAPSHFDLGATESDLMRDVEMQAVELSIPAPAGADPVASAARKGAPRSSLPAGSGGVKNGRRESLSGGARITPQAAGPAPAPQAPQSVAPRPVEKAQRQAPRRSPLPASAAPSPRQPRGQSPANR